mgnify:CR=1 FL=1
MAGRKPKPAARQIAEGDPRKRGKHKLIDAQNREPDAKRGLPECPKHLKGLARDMWNFWADELAHMNLDRRPDAASLEGACRHYARAVEADAILDRDGLIVEESMIDKESGERIVLKVKTHPAVGISSQAWRDAKAFMSEFGLAGPSSRVRLAVDKPEHKKTENLMELLSAPREPRKPVVQ